jgi:hypothetical protein
MHINHHSVSSVIVAVNIFISRIATWINLLLSGRVSLGVRGEKRLNTTALETLFHSTLYLQSCWCIIQVIHNYI